MCLSNPLEICIGFLNVLNIEIQRWNTISETKILVQRFSITKNHLHHLFEERIWLQIIILTFCLTYPLSLSLSLSLFPSYISLLNDYCLGISCLHISYIFTGISASFLFGGIYAVHFNLKGNAILYKATKYKPP